MVETEFCLVRVLAFHGLYGPSCPISSNTVLDSPGRLSFPLQGSSLAEAQRKVIPGKILIQGGG